MAERKSDEPVGESAGGISPLAFCACGSTLSSHQGCPDGSGQFRLPHLDARAISPSARAGGEPITNHEIEVLRAAAVTPEAIEGAFFRQLANKLERLRIAAPVEGNIDPWKVYGDDRRPEGVCYDCGIAYTDPGFHDLLVPNEVWEQIKPSVHKSAGRLCPTCIVRRCAVRGIEGVRAEWRSGPFCAPVGSEERGRMHFIGWISKAGPSAPETDE